MRIRITFAKNGALRYIGHLDLHKMWERAARRADLPLSYTQGFHPTPKIQLASALPLGFSSRCELVDMWIEGEPDLVTLPEKLQQSVPPGLKILVAEQVDEKGPPLQTQVIAAEFEVTLPSDVDENTLAQNVAAVMGAESLPRERRGKAYDLRPLIEELSLIPGNLLFMRLTAREGATGRPEEVLSALGYGDEGWRVERSRLVCK